MMKTPPAPTASQEPLAAQQLRTLAPEALSPATLNAALQAIMNGEPLYILRATLSEIDTISGMISDAKQRLTTLGTDQWSTDWSDKDGRKRNDRVEHSIRAGKTWLAVVILPTKVIPVATVTIEENANPAVWTDQEVTAEPAVYLSRLVTAKGFSSLHIGTAVIDWAAQWGKKKYGARWVRIDVWTSNKALHTYYEKRGFTSCGLVPDESYPARALYQMPTTHVNGYAPTTVEIDAPV